MWKSPEELQLDELSVINHFVNRSIQPHSNNFPVYWLVWLNCFCFSATIVCKQKVLRGAFTQASRFPDPLPHICYARLERLTSLQSHRIAARFVESTTKIWMGLIYPSAARSLLCALVLRESTKFSVCLCASRGWSLFKKMDHSL